MNAFGSGTGTRARPSICFVAPAIWPVLSRSSAIQSVGGAEVQQCMLARAFAAAGYRVSAISMDYGQDDGIEWDGITVWRAHAPNAGLPALRFFHPRLTSLWAAMQRADAQIYYQRSSGMLTALVARFCRAFGRRCVFAAAHDADFEPDLPLIRYRRDKWLYRHGLARVDAVIAQSEAQALACHRHFGREAVVVPSCHAAPPDASADRTGYVLWVATLRQWKRPELFIELARRLPALRFRMVGGPDDRALYDRVRSAAAALPNLEFDGFVPYAGIDQCFNGARLFVNTSEAEGFPNTFLQAWARGIPEVSFLEHGGTLRAADIDEMARMVDRLMSDDIAWRAASLECTARYRARHTPAAALAGYERLFLGWHESRMALYEPT
jgi:glycosyltransferase involved in cell wall biosynthesis